MAFDAKHEQAPADALELEIISQNHGVFSAQFPFWIADNWHVWREFKRQADSVWARGVRHYSARTIIHWLRHHTSLYEVGSEPWKINDHCSPDLARLYALRYPERTSLFETRVLSISKRAA